MIFCVQSIAGSESPLMSQVCVSHRVTWVFQSFSFPLIQANVSRRGSPKVCVLPYPPGEKIRTFSHLQMGHPERKFIFQRLVFRGYVSFRDGNLSTLKVFLKMIFPLPFWWDMNFFLPWRVPQSKFCDFPFLFTPLRGSCRCCFRSYIS